MNWHNLTEDPNDLPKKTGWYVVKVKSSDDLHIIYGYESVSSEHFDAWLMVECPY